MGIHGSQDLLIFSSSKAEDFFFQISQLYEVEFRDNNL